MQQYQPNFPATHRSSGGRTKVDSTFVAFLRRANQRAAYNEPISAGVTISEQMPPAIIWLTVAQMAVKHPAWSENSLRALIFASKDRVGAVRRGTQNIIPGNGLAVAIRRVGRRVLINETAFLEWVERHGSVDRNARS